MSSNRPLDIYKANYQSGLPGDIGLHSVFLQIRQRCSIHQVLYPGSYLHITPSLFFPHVSYVDSITGISNMLADPDLQEYIAQNKVYPEPADIRCYEQDYHTFNSAPRDSFDLLISLNAGLISQSCERFLVPGGMLLVNDEHYDARRAFVDPRYSLIGVFEWGNSRMGTSPVTLSSHFKTEKGMALTLEMVNADLARPPSKARFRTAKSATVFLFEKQG